MSPFEWMRTRTTSLSSRIDRLEIKKKLSVGFGVHGEHKLFWLGTRLSRMLSNELDEGYRQASGGRISRKRLWG